MARRSVLLFLAEGSLRCDLVGMGKGERGKETGIREMETLYGCGIQWVGR